MLTTDMSLVYLDRYRNVGTRSYSAHADYSEVAEQYRPDSHFPEFEVPAFLLPRDDVRVYTAQPADDLLNYYLPGDAALFCVHPQVLGGDGEERCLDVVRGHGRPQPPIVVSPSSSSRTVFVNNDLLATPHALKLHLPLRVSRYTRRMRDEVVEQAVELSGELERGVGRLDEDFAFMREVIGVTHRVADHETERGEAWGYVVREMRPFPEVAGERMLVPGFALYGGDFFDPSKEPLLWDLVQGRDPTRFVLERILLPVVRHWCACYREFGFMLEPHGQNVLFELDEQGLIRRAVHRDLSVGIDMRRRRDLGLEDGRLNDYNRMEDGAFASMTYDMFVGNHFFSPLIRLLETRGAVDRDELSGPCREEFARCFPDYAEYLPDTVWYFSETRDEYGKPLYEDTGRKPEWRPA